MSENISIPPTMNHQPQMTPQEALSVVDQACSQLLMNRADHLRVINAIRVLIAVVNSSSDKSDQKPK